MTQLDNALRKAFAARRSAEETSPAKSARPIREAAPASSRTPSRDGSSPPTRSSQPVASVGSPSTAVPPRVGPEPNDTMYYQDNPYRGAHSPDDQSGAEDRDHVGTVRQRIRRRQAAIRRPLASGPVAEPRASYTQNSAWPAGYAAPPNIAPHAAHAAHTAQLSQADEDVVTPRIREAVAAELGRMMASQPVAAQAERAWPTPVAVPTSSARTASPAAASPGRVHAYGGRPDTTLGHIASFSAFETAPARPAGFAAPATAKQDLEVVRRQGEELTRIIDEVRRREHELSNRESDISRREKGLAEQETRLAVLRSSLDRHADDLSAREATLSDREKTLRTAAERLERETDSLTKERHELSSRQTVLAEEIRRIESAKTDLDLERASWKKQRNELASQEQQLAATKKSLAEKSETLAQDEAALAGLRAEITAQQAAIADERRRFETESAGLRTKSAETERRAADIAARAEAIRSQADELATREASLKTIENEVKGQHSGLRQREAELKLRHSALQQRESDLKDQESHLRHESEACRAGRTDLAQAEQAFLAQQADLEARTAVIRQQQELLLSQLASVTDHESSASRTASPQAKPTSVPAAAKAPGNPSANATNPSETKPSEAKAIAATPKASLASSSAVAASPRSSATAASRNVTSAKSALPNPQSLGLSAEEYAVLTGTEPAHVATSESAAEAEHATEPSRGQRLIADLPGTHRLDQPATEKLAGPRSGRVASPATALATVGSLSESFGQSDRSSRSSLGGGSGENEIAAFAQGPSWHEVDRSDDAHHDGEHAAPPTNPSGHPSVHENVMPKAPAENGIGAGSTMSTGSEALSPADLASIRSLWEVDRWEWPSVVLAVSELLGPAFEQAGSRLIEEAAAGRKVWAVGSIGRGCGATTVAACLARWAGAAGVDTILVDANFASPDLASRFELGEDVCWSETLRGAQVWGESSITSISDRVTLAPLVNVPERPETGPFLRRMKQAIAPIRDAYGLVVLDVPAFGEDGGLELAECVDAALIITDGTAAQTERCRQVREQLKARGVKPVFLVENRLADSPIRATVGAA